MSCVQRPASISYSSGCTTGASQPGTIEQAAEKRGLKAKVSSLKSQEFGRFLRLSLEPCYLRLQVAGFFSNLPGRAAKRLRAVNCTR
jgi:hypothetical protein